MGRILSIHEKIGQQPLHYDSHHHEQPGLLMGAERRRQTTNQSLGFFNVSTSLANQKHKEWVCFFFHAFLLCPYRARRASLCTSRLSSSAPRSHGLCGCTPACSR
uniref:Uncharacterized protein n=1 Tax=Zea mays TaxID=4577 RepID=C4IZE3_MAIZE|nr:unknown [Zea mays]